MIWKILNNRKEKKLEKKVDDINKKLSEILKYQKMFPFDKILNYQKEAPFDKILNYQKEAPFDKIQEALLENGEQLGRISRLQYKNGQDTLKNIALIQNRIEDLSNVCMAGSESMTVASLENKVHALLFGGMQCIDNVDILLRDQEEISEEWSGFLSSIQRSLLESLQKAGIKEIILLGTAFNSFFAESLGTISPSELKNHNKAYLPYEIVAILKRGFIGEDGRVVRKAQVITIGEN